MLSEMPQPFGGNYPITIRCLMVRFEDRGCNFFGCDDPYIIIDTRSYDLLWTHKLPGFVLVSSLLIQINNLN